ncbi:hypothetical protein chiPu_0031307, partial [Chiloscyllium punctatum]|nr:hypothetical protein [Chiloscyllium punctatum]
LSQRMGVDADEQRPGQALLAAVIADRLRGGEDVVLVERILQRRAAMARGAERNPLGGIAGVRLSGEIRRDQPRHIGER